MTESNFSERLARLEERMETVKAELGEALADFRADMAANREGQERFRADMAARETRITKDIRGEFRVGLMVAVAVIGLVVTIAALLVG